MKDDLVEFEGYFRSEEFVANALGLRKEIQNLSYERPFTMMKPTDALAQALRQWRMYANDLYSRDLDLCDDAEGRTYRDCMATLNDMLGFSTHVPE